METSVFPFVVLLSVTACHMTFGQSDHFMNSQKAFLCSVLLCNSAFVASSNLSYISDIVVVVNYCFFAHSSLALVH